MTEEGQKILCAVQQIRELHSNISLLLLTADAAMGKSGWRNAKADKTAISDQSYSIDLPERWMPWEIFRFYKHEAYPSFLASITVLIDDAERRITEPLIAASIIDFGSGKPIANFQNWLGGIFKSLGDRVENGKLCKATTEQIPESWHDNFERVWCFAHPLSEVTSENFLREKVVDRLIGLAANPA